MSGKNSSRVRQGEEGGGGEAPVFPQLYMICEINTYPLISFEKLHQKSYLYSD